MAQPRGGTWVNGKYQWTRAQMAEIIRAAVPETTDADIDLTIGSFIGAGLYDIEMGEDGEIYYSVKEEYQEDPQE